MIQSPGSEGQEVARRIPGGVPIAPAQHIEVLPANEDRVAEMWVRCHEGIHTLAVYFWHGAGWSLGNEAPVSAASRRVATSRHHWVIACDATMEPREFARGNWGKES